MIGQKNHFVNCSHKNREYRQRLSSKTRVLLDIPEKTQTQISYKFGKKTNFGQKSQKKPANIAKKIARKSKSQILSKDHEKLTICVKGSQKILEVNKKNG